MSRIVLLFLMMGLPAVFAAAAPLRQIKNSVFGPGESFQFDVRYGFISGGFARMEVLDTVRIRGFLCHRIRSIANSNRALSFLFPVRDTAYSYLDVDGLFSLKIVKFIREGSYQKFRWTFFEPEKNRAVTRDSVLTTAPFPQDVLSAFYFLRTLHFTDLITINCFDDYKNYPLEIAVKGREAVHTPAGKFNCLKLEPRLLTSGIFLKNGKMTVWVTDDEFKMPVMLQFKMPYLGHITCRLTKYDRGAIVPQYPARNP